MARIAASGIPRAWSARGFASELSSSGSEGWLARPGGAPDAPPVGELLLHRVLDEAEIRSLAVLPAARRRGVASALLGAVLAHASAAGVRLFHLEVRAGNAAARALYQDLGFAVVGRRPRYYPDGEAALLLSRGSEAPAVAGRLR
jgi:ribosomal protein S18 acetylase RimI-like enzyme